MPFAIDRLISMSRRNLAQPRVHKNPKLDLFQRNQCSFHKTDRKFLSLRQVDRLGTFPYYYFYLQPFFNSNSSDFCGLYGYNATNAFDGTDDADGELCRNRWLDPFELGLLLPDLVA